MLEARLLEPLGPRPGEPEPRRDQRRVESRAPGVGGQLLEVLPHQRLAAGQPELEHAQLAGLGEDPLPVVGVSSLSARISSSGLEQ